jgi:hypothetical protein
VQQLDGKHCTELQQFHCNHIPKGSANEKLVCEFVHSNSKMGQVPRAMGHDTISFFRKTTVQHSSRIEIKVM